MTGDDALVRMLSNAPWSQSPSRVCFILSKDVVRDARTEKVCCMPYIHLKLSVFAWHKGSVASGQSVRPWPRRSVQNQLQFRFTPWFLFTKKDRKIELLCGPNDYQNRETILALRVPERNAIRDVMTMFVVWNKLESLCNTRFGKTERKVCRCCGVNLNKIIISEVFRSQNSPESMKSQKHKREMCAW